MNGIKEYLFRVTIAAVVSSILLRLAGKKSSTEKVITLLSGLMMAITVFSPLVKLNPRWFQLYPINIASTAEIVAQEGTTMADNAMDTIIISKLEAYILDKATSLGADLDVKVVLDDHMPKSVYLQGAISPGSKQRLSAWIASDLNIPLEAQKWN